MKRSRRSNRIRRVLIPLNLVLATGMLLSLTLGTPSIPAIATAMVITTAASIIAVIFER
jgi:hypothetical protein